MSKLKNASYSENNELLLDDCNYKDLTNKYGTPLYTINETILRKNCELYTNILNSIYPNSIISYASKAFCCKYVYKIIKDYNLFCDVVSGGELYTALSSKFNPNNIIFHGNNKTLEEIKFALKSKVGYYVIDGNDDFENLLSVLNSQKTSLKQINVLLRVNPGVEAHTHEFIQTAKPDSKFGVGIDNGEALKLIFKILETNKLNFVGLHYHIGSQLFDKTAYSEASKKIMSFVCFLKQKHNIDTKVIDCGGGIGVWYTSKDPVLKEDDYKKILLAIVNEIKNNVTKYNLIEPKLIIEPGRSLIAEAGTTLYTVGTIKEIKGVRKYVAVDGGMFENPRYALYNAEYTAIKCHHTTNKQEKVTIVGKCCESGDILIKDIKMEELQKGDNIAILSTGAYNYSMASNYNRNLIPPVVAVYKGKAKLIVKGQTYKDIARFDK